MIARMPVPLLHVPQLPPPPDVAKPPDDAVQSIDPANPRRFIFSKVLAAGSGSAHPDNSKLVTVHYTAWSIDGTTIDDSRSRGKPAVWSLQQLMDGLAWGLQLMVVGEKRRVWIPAVLAHEWATDMLVYDVELLGMTPAAPRPTADELGGPPADATRTSSGLAFKVLRSGTGTERPKPASTVTIHYTAWTSRGSNVFDETIQRNAPLTTPVDTVMPGLTEALQLMVIGERTRFWIPPALGYPPPLPSAMIVVDVELVAIQHAGDGQPGTVRVQVNSPDAVYRLIMPDGTTREGRGPQTFPNAPPGAYRITPVPIPLFSIAMIAQPADMTLTAGGTLEITINFNAIVH
jgi:FKBP-type peptidyl-prolyl cis-trans isomerase